MVNGDIGLQDMLGRIASESKKAESKNEEKLKMAVVKQVMSKPLNKVESKTEEEEKNSPNKDEDATVSAAPSMVMTRGKK